MSTSSPLLESKWTWALIPGALASTAIAFAIAASVAEPRLRELEWLRSVPLADPASPTEKPARYQGKLRGPEGRTTPAGDRAAAFWWVVAHRDSEGSDTIYCTARERSRLVLDTPSGVIPIAFTEAEPKHVGLIDDEKDDEYGMPIAIDLGNTRRTHSEVIPSGTCLGDGAKYEQSAIAEGAAVEVVGCLKAGAIHTCNAPLHAVLAAPDLEVHRRHRADDARLPFRGALLAVAQILLFVGGAFVAMMRPKQPATPADAAPAEESE